MRTESIFVFMKGMKADEKDKLRKIFLDLSKGVLTVRKMQSYTAQTLLLTMEYEERSDVMAQHGEGDING